MESTLFFITIYFIRISLVLKNDALALIGRKKNPCSTNEIEKNFFALLQEISCTVAKLFHHPRGP